MFSCTHIMRRKITNVNTNITSQTHIPVHKLYRLNRSANVASVQTLNNT